MYRSKRVLRSFVSSTLPHSMLGGKQSMAACVGEQRHGPRRTDPISLVFRYASAFSFTSHPHRRKAPPTPLPVAFQCKWGGRAGWRGGGMNGCSWPIKRLALLKGLEDIEIQPGHTVSTLPHPTTLCPHTLTPPSQFIVCTQHEGGRLRPKQGLEDRA